MDALASTGQAAVCFGSRSAGICFGGNRLERDVPSLLQSGMAVDASRWRNWQMRMEAIADASSQRVFGSGTVAATICLAITAYPLLFGWTPPERTKVNSVS